MSEVTLYSQVDILSPRYNSVNFAKRKIPSPNRPRERQDLKLFEVALRHGRLAASGRSSNCSHVDMLGPRHNSVNFAARNIPASPYQVRGRQDLELLEVVLRHRRLAAEQGLVEVPIVHLPATLVSGTEGMQLSVPDRLRALSLTHTHSLSLSHTISFYLSPGRSSASRHAPPRDAPHTLTPHTRTSSHPSVRGAVERIWHM